MALNGTQRQCRVKKRARDNKYLLTEKGRSRQRRFRLAEHLADGRAHIQRLEELLT